MSFNLTIWRFAPKHLQCGSKTIEIAVYLAVGIINEGLNAILKTMTTIGVTIGLQAKLFADYRNSQRMKIAARVSAQNY